MNSKSIKKTMPEVFPFHREYYLAEIRKPTWIPEACDYCNENFFEIFILKPKIEVYKSDDLWLCESCKNRVLIKREDGTATKSMAK